MIRCLNESGYHPNKGKPRISFCNSDMALALLNQNTPPDFNILAISANDYSRSRTCSMTALGLKWASVSSNDRCSVSIPQGSVGAVAR